MDKKNESLEFPSLFHSKTKEYFNQLENSVDNFPFTNEDVKPSKIFTNDLAKKFDESEMIWLQSLNRLKPGERIFCDFNRKGESVAIVLDENGKYVRIYD